MEAELNLSPGDLEWLRQVAEQLDASDGDGLPDHQGLPLDALARLAIHATPADLEQVANRIWALSCTVATTPGGRSVLRLAALFLRQYADRVASDGS